MQGTQLNLFEVHASIDKMLTHERESTSANEAIYKAQKVRLSRNGRILLLCLLEGQTLTGLKIMQGVRHSGMQEPVVMTEYRRRWTEIRKLIGAQNLKEKIYSDGHKEWSLDFGSIVQIKSKLKDLL